MAAPERMKDEGSPEEETQIQNMFGEFFNHM